MLGIHCCGLFSSCGEWGLLSRGAVRASHCGGSRREGFCSYGTWARSYGTWAELVLGMCPDQGSNRSVSAALAVRFFTPEPPETPSKSFMCGFHCLKGLVVFTHRGLAGLLPNPASCCQDPLWRPVIPLLVSRGLITKVGDGAKGPILQPRKLRSRGTVGAHPSLPFPSRPLCFGNACQPSVKVEVAQLCPTLRSHGQ